MRKVFFFLMGEIAFGGQRGFSFPFLFFLSFFLVVLILDVVGVEGNEPKRISYCRSWARSSLLSSWEMSSDTSRERIWYLIT